MFSNIGSKIKKLASILCWVGIIASVIGGIVCFVIAGQLGSYGGGMMVLYGFLAIIVGSLLAWIGSFFTYGFGELIETNQQIRDGLAGQPMPAPRPTQSGAPYGGYAQPAQAAPQRAHRPVYDQQGGYNARPAQPYNQPQQPAAQQPQQSAQASND